MTPVLDCMLVVATAGLVKSGVWQHDTGGGRYSGRRCGWTVCSRVFRTSKGVTVKVSKSAYT